MVSSFIPLPSNSSADVTPARPRLASLSLLRRFRTELRLRLDMTGSPQQMLRLNDRLLRDIDVTREELEYKALFWPIWRCPPTRRC
jgi:uncharacterized protein YjiS (DUF1127 family)